MKKIFKVTALALAAAMTLSGCAASGINAGEAETGQTPAARMETASMNNVMGAAAENADADQEMPPDEYGTVSESTVPDESSETVPETADGDAAGRNTDVVPGTEPYEPEPSGNATSVSENIVFFGDSLVAGLTVGQDERYATILSCALGMDEYNFAVSGAGFACGLGGETPDPENIIIKQVEGCSMTEAEISETSLVIVAAGWNDLACGQVNDYGSLETAVDRVLDAVLARFPGAKVFFVYGENSWKVTEFEQQYAEWTAKVQEHVRNTYGSVCVVTGYGNATERNVIYYNDTIHPNAEGHRIIAGWLGNILFEQGW